MGGKQLAFTREAHWKERGLKLATKFYPNPSSGGHDGANIRAKLEWDLQQLGTDCVDIFYLHAPDRATNFAETLEECNKMHKEGKFVELGLSNFAAFEVAECAMICNERGWVRPTIYQGMLNAISEALPASLARVFLTCPSARSLQSETVTACHRYGIQVVVYNPLAGGLFSGRIRSRDIIPDDNSRFGKQSHAGERYRERYYRDGTFEALELVEKAAQKHDLTTLEIALRWVMHHSTLNCKDNGGDGIIIGVSSLAQLEGNLKDLEKGPLPDDVVQTLDEAWLLCTPHTPVYWHGDL